MSTPRLIKKYPNRRLYDTELGAYITLEEVKKLVFDHIEFEVVDARTKKDLTESTLLQIIIEQETSTTPLFNRVVLQNFIRFYQTKSQPFFSQYLEQTLKWFTEQKEMLQNPWLAYQKLLSDPLYLQKMFLNMQPHRPTQKKPDDDSQS